MPAGGQLGLADPWDWLRVEYAQRAPQFLAAALPGPGPGAGAVRAAPRRARRVGRARRAARTATTRAVLVLDGRGEVASHLAGVYRDGELDPLAAQELPHSLGLLYEDLTRHLGFLHSSDEYKVMALASYGKPRHLALLRELVRATDDGGFTVERDRLVGAGQGRAPADGEMTDDARRPGRQRAGPAGGGRCSTWPAGCTTRPAARRRWPWPAGSR